MPIYLAAKEIWRNKARFTAVSLVIALITLLVLFVAALGEGLAEAGKQYIEKLDGEVVVFQENVDLLIPSSRLSRSVLNDLARVDGVTAVGPVGFSNASIINPETGENVDVSLIGVEPGLPGSPPVTAGRPLESRRGNDLVVDQNLLDLVDLEVGQVVGLRVVQGTREEIYELTVVGQTSGQKYGFLPGVFVPLVTWDQIRPGGASSPNPTDLAFNIAVVQTDGVLPGEAKQQRITAEVSGVETADIVTTYENVPGYTAQQSTVNTQKSFTLLIAVLVIGGFFQIQTLQKVGQIGMLKAIGASNVLVAITLIVQVVLTTIIGISIGSGAAYIFSLTFPPNTPIVFQGNQVLVAILSLFAIGPIGGLVSIRTLLKVEPLTALGLGS